MVESGTSRRRRKQSVWFVRYGLTEHPLVEGKANVFDFVIDLIAMNPIQRLPSWLMLYFLSAM